MNDASAPAAGRAFAVTHRGILAIAVPMTLAYLSTPLLGITDMAVIGRIGDAALIGGVALGAVIFDFIFSTFNFLRSGTTGLTAQAYGAGDRPEMQAVLFRALLIALAIGVAVILLGRPILTLALAGLGGSPAVQAATTTYFDIRLLSTPFALANYAMLGWLVGLGRATAGLVLQTVLNGLNIALTVLFVLGFGWGIAGAGLGTAVGEAVTACLGLLVILPSLDRRDRPARAVVLDRAAIMRWARHQARLGLKNGSILFDESSTFPGGSRAGRKRRRQVRIVISGKQRDRRSGGFDRARPAASRMRHR